MKISHLLTTIIISFFIIVSCDKKNPTDSNGDAIDKGTVKDIDGNIYQTLRIGNQWWMAENLKVTHYLNGDAIPNVTDSTTWINLTSDAYCNYDNDSSYVATYGCLYNWYTVNDSRNIAPLGWHVPTDGEWKELEMYLGMSQSECNTYGFRGINEGGKLKEIGTTHWASPNEGATNESGFSALPGSSRYAGGNFAGMSYFTAFWTTTEDTTLSIWVRYLDNNHSKISRDRWLGLNGISVRCVKD